MSLDPAELTETLATLADKSLVTSDRTTAMRYRLLDTTRAYAWQKLTESGEGPKIVRRHCEHMIHASGTARSHDLGASEPREYPFLRS